MKIGVFGGSFNPPHIGHLLVCQYTLSMYGLDEVLVIPAKEHPFNKPLLEFWQRYELCCIMCRPHDKLHVMNYDHKYTVDLLKYLIKWNPQDSFHLIVGSDILRDRDKWKDWDKIQDIVDIITVYRKGYGEECGEPPRFGEFVFPNINSTDIRRRLARGSDVDGLIPKKVLEYIKHNKLEF